jgi:hypothetical protein
MFGKTVKVRRCPATVSAPVSWPVLWAGPGFQPGSFRPCAEGSTKPLEASPEPAFGKVAGEGVSQETGPRRFTRLRSEGNEGALCLFPSIYADNCHVLAGLYP